MSEKNGGEEISQRVKELCIKTLELSEKHKKLFKKGRIIPRPYFFRKLLQDKKYPSVDFQIFVQQHITQIMSDEWLDNTNFNNDYIYNIESRGLYIKTEQNYLTSDYKDQVSRQLSLILDRERREDINIDVIDTLKSLGLSGSEDYLIENVHDKYTIKAFQYVLDSLLDSEDETGQTARIKIHSFIQDYHRIGEHSSNGTALKASIGNCGYNNNRKAKLNSVVIKVPKCSAKNNELIHEAAIGNYLNEIRDETVCFSAVYDGYLGGAPIISSEGKVHAHYLQGENKVYHAIYESVNGGRPISEIEDRDHLLCTLINLFVSLNTANKKYKFTHYDCHASNVRMFEYSDETFYIPHNYKGLKLYVKTKRTFPMCIDYGMSHIQFKENDTVVNHGILDPTGGMSSRGIYNDIDNPISDCFKQLCFLTLKFNDKVTDRKKTGVKNIENFIKCRNLTLRLLGYFFGCPCVDRQNLERNKNDDLFGISISNFSTINLNLWDEMRYHLRLELVNEYNYKIEDLIDYCIEIAQTTIPDSIVYQEPENCLGKLRIRRPQNKEQQALQIERQLNDMGIHNVQIVDAKDLFISRLDDSKERIEMLFLENVSRAVLKDMERISELLNYKWKTPIFIFPSETTFSSESIDSLKENLCEIADFIQKVSQLNDEISIFTYANEKSNSIYKELLDRLISKNQELETTKQKIKSAVTRSYKNINKKIFADENVSEERIIEYINENRKHSLADYYFTLLNVYKSVNSF